MTGAATLQAGQVGTNLQFLNVSGIDLTALVGSFGILVEIVAAHLQEIGHPAQFLQVQMQTITVQSHLAQIGTYAQNAAAFHLAPDTFQFLLADAKVQLLVAAVIHRASPSLSR